MKKKYNKKTATKGFTLVELLAVLVIMGIILGITIPSAVELIDTQSDRKYSYHEKIVEQATNAYVDQYKETFEEEQGSCSCYKIPYNLLLKEDLIKEEDITCEIEDESETRGMILAYPTNSDNDGFHYEYYLTCRDKKTNQVIHEKTLSQGGCCGVNGSFLITEAVVKYNDENGDIYPQTNNNWTKENVYQRFSANDPYMAGIKGYEYSLDGGLTWTFVGSNNFTFKTDMNSTVQVRAVDNDGNRSMTKSYTVRIDKTAPTAEFNVEGTLGEKNWYTSNVYITPKNVRDTGSGVANSKVDISEIKDNTTKDGQVVTLTATDKVGNVLTKTITIKVDKDTPTPAEIVVSGTEGENGWYISDVTITYKGGLAGPSGFSTSVTPTKVTEDTKSVEIKLTTKAGNGLKAYASKTIKVDKTPPSNPTKTSHTKGSISASGSTDISKVSYRYYVSTSSSTPTDKSEFGTGNTYGASCGTTYYAWVYAINEAGLSTGIFYTNSVTTEACCTLKSGSCSESEVGQKSECNGASRTCTPIPHGDDTCSWSGNSMSGSGSDVIKIAYCSCNSDWYNKPYNSGGQGSNNNPYAVLSGDRRTLTDYVGSYIQGQQSFRCSGSCPTYEYKWE